MRLFGMFALMGLVIAMARPAAAQDDQWITIKGKVVLAVGEMIPSASEIEVKQDKAHCESKGKLLEEKFQVNAKNRGIKNVVVWIGVDADPKKAPPFPKESIHPKLVKSAEMVEIDQPCCAFTPHVLLARDGQKLVVKNSSPVPHNVNWSSKLNGSGNVSLPAGGKYEFQDTLKADRLPMEVRCNVHPWMNAWVRVFDHPYYTLTDENGDFEIKLAPTGTFRIFYWHEDIGFKDGAEGRAGKVIELKAGGGDMGKVEMKK